MSAFPQNGSWNMLDLAELPVTCSLGVLSRYCAGRVNPYTALVGQALSAPFSLSSGGRKRIDNTLSKLGALSTLGDTLFFGFGIEDMVRSLAGTEQGAVCLILCAALTECFSEDTAVEVLLELAACRAVDKQYMPSSFEWKALLKACAGVLSTSDFPLRAEFFMALAQKESGAADTMATRYGKSSPKSIAEALLGLAQISRREIHAVTIIGSAAAGWLAALAEWMFDISVQVQRDKTELLYRNDYIVNPHLTVVYPGSRSSSTNVDHHDTLELHGKTYHLENIADVLTGVVLDNFGRVEWKKALSAAFMSDFATLMSNNRALGQALGAAARFFMLSHLTSQASPSRSHGTSGCVALYRLD
nr:hypothetical protein CFP56_76466 [Quercus suber]